MHKGHAALSSTVQHEKDNLEHAGEANDHKGDHTGHVEERPWNLVLLIIAGEKSNGQARQGVFCGAIVGNNIDSIRSTLLPMDKRDKLCFVDLLVNSIDCLGSPTRRPIRVGAAVWEGKE
jgi:hypothetical protein